jgi:glycerol-3-phosphate O-acyltransferase/dihydroxyacetone phosphate acyltransferase
MLRLTAKSTQFGRKTFTSWLIESAGTVPIKRRKDYIQGSIDNVDNSEVMGKLMEALEMGDAICLFPEGASRYHPTIAPLKTGVSRIVSDVLTRNRDNPEFEISVLTCSITYMHRQHFRSDVLVTFNPPMTFRVKDNPELLAPVDYEEIRSLTARIHQEISSRTIDAPSWEIVRTAKLASRLYVPLGTRMSLGDYVRVTRIFVEAFKASDCMRDANESIHGDEKGEYTKEDAELVELRRDLKIYQDQLSRWGIKDDRIRQPLSRRTIISRLLIRLTWSLFLFTISLPGLLLWFPVFGTTFYAVYNFKKSGGPVWDTWDEIAQYKLIYGLISGLCVWFASILITLPVAGFTAVVVPCLMWITLRWLEDAVSAFRAFAALVRLLRVGKSTLKGMRQRREGLHGRVMNLAVQTLGLPENPETYFLEAGGGEARYFSVRRRRKRDWNETLRLYDKTDYPDDSL